MLILQEDRKLLSVHQHSNHNSIEVTIQTGFKIQYTSRLFLKAALESSQTGKGCFNVNVLMHFFTLWITNPWILSAHISNKTQTTYPHITHNAQESRLTVQLKLPVHSKDLQMKWLWIVWGGDWGFRDLESAVSLIVSNHQLPGEVGALLCLICSVLFRDMFLSRQLLKWGMKAGGGSEHVNKLHFHLAALGDLLWNQTSSFS